MYFVALVLPPELDKLVLNHKNYMFQKYQCKVGLKSPAHITLIPPFWMESEKEMELTGAITLLNSFVTFTLETRQFSAFKPRTIFIDVIPSEQLSRLKQLIDHLFRSNEAFTVKVDEHPFHPHITIATRDLHKKDFSEAWLHFQEKKIEMQWLVNGVSVLRHNKKNWDVIFTSQFQNQ